MYLSTGTNILFPNLGIELNNVGQSISIFGFEIAYYGIIIAFGMAMGYMVAHYQAKRTGQNPEIYLDFALWAIILSVLGARLYYVAFAWDEFKDRPLDIINLRTGGLAIYGGIITGVITALVYTKVKKLNTRLFVDTACLGLITGQLIGRWGNFFNREAFGKYYNGLFSMNLDIRDVGGEYIRPIELIASRYADQPDALERIIEIRENAVKIGEATYIQVHPTFLYESVWNFALLIILLIYSKHKKFDGEIFLLYILGYGLGRVWIEGLRTDQLFLWGSPLAVSQILSGILVIISGIVIIYGRKKVKKSSGK